MRPITATFLIVLALASPAAPETLHRHYTRCCIMVPTDDGSGERPYCFVLRVRPPRYGRRVCRAIGGRPQRHVVE